MSRFPYTYAADFIRSIPDVDISRADAAAIWHSIAKVLELDQEMTAEKLATHYLENEKEIEERCFRKSLELHLQNFAEQS